MTEFTEIPLPIRISIEDLPEAIFARSGSIFYSGIEAFSRSSPIYILGLNPGGGPTSDPKSSIRAYTERFKCLDKPWSEYADESWEGAQPGCWGLQPRILHLLNLLGLDPRLVPASNVVFAQTRNEQELAAEKSELLQACWPFHQAVIDNLGVRVVLCFGVTAGSWVRERLAATEQIDKFSESNGRGWTSWTHRDEAGLQVVTLTHPSRADWRNPMADPTPLVARAIARIT